MRRILTKPRMNHKEKLEEIGFSFHSWDDYWNESVYYQINANQIDILEQATNELHQMCLVAVQYVIDRDRFDDLKIPRSFIPLIIKSWDERQPSIYGRFDLAYDGTGVPKMLEYNADTPTSLLEAAVAQWQWMEEEHSHHDQFNSIHEKLVESWKAYRHTTDTIHFTSMSDNEEDWVCIHYLMDTAAQAGFNVKHLYIEDIGVGDQFSTFVDLDNNPIKALFKLYPWEWIFTEPFGVQIAVKQTQFIEPPWKAILSNKGILAILWELFPCNQYLVPAFFTPNGMESYAKKPLFSREGSNIELYYNGKLLVKDTGPYGAEGHVYQQLINMPNFGSRYPVIGSWIVGDRAAGIGVREDSLKITTNMSQFVPHFFTA